MAIELKTNNENFCKIAYNKSCKTFTIALSHEDSCIESYLCVFVDAEELKNTIRILEEE